MAGTQIPGLILTWNFLHDGQSGHPKKMVKKAKDEKIANFIFWGAAASDIYTCAASIKPGSSCVGCGKADGLKQGVLETYRLNALIYGGYYNLPNRYRIKVSVCASCDGSGPSVSSYYCEQGSFLVVRLSELSNRKGYAALINANAISVVPYFELRTWRQLSDKNLRSALRKLNI